MKNIVRLTESELTRVVKRLINEEVRKSPFDTEGRLVSAGGPYSKKDKTDINKGIKNIKQQIEQAEYEVERLERLLDSYEKMRNTWIKSKEE